MDNTNKTVKNSLVSVIAQILTMLMSFINRRVFVIFLDIEFLGYQSLFGNVFILLSVAELGIGNIISFHLYKEIVENNQNEIGRLMYLYKWLYRIVATIVLISGIICSFFLPLFLKGATSSWEYIYLVFYLQLAGVVLGYFLSYKRTIFIAAQQEYKCIRIELLVNVGIQALQLVLLAIFRNYIVYLCLQLSISLISNFIISVRCNRQYPYLKGKYSVSREYLKQRNLFKDIRDFLIHRVAYAIYGGTDNIIISAVCGVRYVALYGNYVMVKNGVMQVLFYRLLNPVQATIGNIVYSGRPKEDLWKQFEMFDVFGFFFASYISLGFFVFYQPFIQIWMGKEYLLSDTFVVLFSITIYLGAVWEMVYKYRSVFGDYKQDRNCMVLSAILNVAISIIGAKMYGIVGIQFGTLVAFLPIAYGRIRFVVKNYFGKSMLRYFTKHFLLLMVVAIEMLVTHIICNNLPISIIGMIARAGVWLIVPLVINSAVFLRNAHFHEMLQYMKRSLFSIFQWNKKQSHNS